MKSAEEAMEILEALNSRPELQFLDHSAILEVFSQKL